MATLIFLAATVPLTFAQDLQGQPSPVLPGEILGPQLIAWSQLQKPEPVPQPLLPAEQPIQQLDRQTMQPARLQSPAVQTLTGTIVKDGGKYVLKVASSGVYPLNDQDRAKQYEGEQVRVTGTLDANSNSLHITSIELVS